MGGPQSRSRRVRNISPPPGFNPRAVQPVASHYTDSANQAIVPMGAMVIFVTMFTLTTTVIVDFMVSMVIIAYLRAFFIIINMI